MAPCSNGGQHIMLLTIKRFMRFDRPVQHFISSLCFPSIIIMARMVQTMAIYASATQSHTVSSAPVLRARESSGLRT